MRLTKKEIDLLGRKYAEGLYWHRLESPAELPSLVARKDWQQTGKYERRAIISDIARKAEEELLKAGHSRGLVQKLVSNYILGL